MGCPATIFATVRIVNDCDIDSCLVCFARSIDSSFRTFGVVCGVMSTDGQFAEESGRAKNDNWRLSTVTNADWQISHDIEWWDKGRVQWTCVLRQVTFCWLTTSLSCAGFRFSGGRLPEYLPATQVARLVHTPGTSSANNCNFRKPPLFEAPAPWIHAHWPC